jgi:hypothetical protein
MEAVIKGKLFSCPDFPETIEEDLSAESAHRQIRVATMIDELGAASSYCSIKHRAPIQANNVNPPCFLGQEVPYGAARDFPLADSFAGVLDHPLAARDRFFCEHAKAFDPRSANVKLEISELRIDSRNKMLCGHSNRAEQWSKVTNMRLALLRQSLY